MHDDKNYLSFIPSSFLWVLMLSLWKYTFELASKELELLKKKKQALEDLFSSQRISQLTYEHLSREIGETLADVEKYLETVIRKMKGRMDSLEKHLGILEISLANVEILHATGEIDDETYEAQSRALSLGLESMKHEMEEIKGALEKITEKPAEEAVVSEEKEVEEAVSAEPSLEEKPSEPTVEAVEYEEKEPEVSAWPTPSTEEKPMEPMLKSVEHEVEEAEGSTEGSGEEETFEPTFGIG